MKRFSIEDLKLLKEIAITPYKTLFQEIKNEDLKEKRWLISTIDWYKSYVKQLDSQKAREIIKDLIEQLEMVNGRVEWIKAAINES